MAIHRCPICSEACNYALLSHLREEHGLILEHFYGEYKFKCPCGYTIKRDTSYEHSEPIYDHLMRYDDKHRLILMMAAER